MYCWLFEVLIDYIPLEIIEDMDVVLVKHELKERELMLEQGMSYNEAHRIAEEEFNYKKLADIKDGLL